MRYSPEEQMQRVAWGLSIAGAVPFLYFGMETMLGKAILGINSLYALLTYSAVILSFLGGMYWMRALMITGNSKLSFSMLILSVMPSLTGWGGLLMSDSNSILMMVAGFIGLLGVEYRLTEMTLIPAWFWKIRLYISGIVISILLLCWLSV